MNIRWLLIVVVLVSGCTSIKVVNEPVPEILQADKVCIIVHDDTREVFKTTLKEWLREQGITPDVYPQETSVDVCEWTLEYEGRWSWVVALYLADAKITAYHDGAEAGRAWLEIGKWDGHKWEGGKQRIRKLMDMLSGKVDHYELPVLVKDEKA
ncbi:Sbal_3080 family lipoprotein [Desulfovibrio sp. JC010]|uniref:Sbal_3080 family lipoprotein n=1 Tax=Desulfovibrio sp. JC010 TaxID=2593641 RepID=UPI0013D1EAEE|nr:Sbal_3080 family lipoprotein [Desulfovibrio sp. JC010]NDV27755.1 hypothetical protein [Desulfovibrio sp. JC010]